MKILYICTHNRCRSILCEAITNHMAAIAGLGDVLVAKSAGSSPVGQVHPKTLEALKRHGFGVAGLQSQSWDEFEDFDADVVVTVCDQAAGESCPLWFGKATKLHLGLPDPSKLENIDECNKAFDAVIATIEARTKKLIQFIQNGLTGYDLIDAMKHLDE